MPLPNPNYLTDEYFLWNETQAQAVLLATVGGSPISNGTKRTIRWDFLDSIDRERVHNLIMGYANRGAAGSPLIVESTALTSFVAGAAYHTANYNGTVVGGNASGLTADDTPATAGVQEINVGGARIGADATGLANDATVYTASVAVDGGSPEQAISIVGSAAQTYTTLLNELNADLTGATASITNGDILITSNTTGVASTILVSDPGPIGSPESTYLFPALTTYVAISAATDGVGIIAGVGSLLTASVIVNDTTTAFTINGDDATTFTGLITALNTALPAGVTASILAGNIEITTDSTGSGQKVTIVDGTLFRSTTGFVNFEEVRVGVSSLGDIFDLNFRNEYQTYTELLIGKIRNIADKSPRAPLNSSDVYFNHATATWLLIITDVAPA